MFILTNEGHTISIEYVATKRISRAGTRSRIIYLDKDWDIFEVGDLVEIKVKIIKKAKIPLPKEE